MAVACVALSLAVAFGPAAPVRASIEVDASALGDEAESLSRTVADEGQVVLRDADVLPARSENDGTIHVEVTPLSPGPGYGFVAWADRGDAEVDGTRMTGECAGCSDQELAESVAKAIAAMVEPLRASSEQAAPPPEPTPTVEPTPAPAPERADDHGRIKIGALGVGGIVLMGIGVGALGGGAALLARGRDVAPDPGDPSRLEGLDFRPGGGALMAVGVAALVTGAVMLFVGVKKGKEARNRRTALLRGPRGPH
jgi:hypothetical protein